MAREMTIRGNGDGNLWRQNEDIGPIPRSHHAMAYDAKRDRVVLFGGFGSVAPFGDTWELRIESIPE